MTKGKKMDLLFKKTMLLPLALLLFTADVSASEVCDDSPKYSYREPDKELYPNLLESHPVQKEVVATTRAYFYTKPDEQCKSDSYIMKPTKVLSYREHGDFYYVNYINEQNEVVDGWMKREELGNDSSPVNGLYWNDFYYLMNRQWVNFLTWPSGRMEWFSDNKIDLSELKPREVKNGFDSWEIAITSLPDSRLTVAATNGIMEKRLGFASAWFSEARFTHKTFQTARGVTMGDGWDKVVSLYGESYKTNADQNIRYYQYFDMKLSFCLDKHNHVTCVTYDNYPMSASK